MHPWAGVCNLDMGKSDHRSICMDTDNLTDVAAQRPSYGRKFEAKWLAEETVEEILKKAWQKAIHRGLCPTVKSKLDSVRKDLHVWDRKNP